MNVFDLKNILDDACWQLEKSTKQVKDIYEQNLLLTKKLNKLQNEYDASADNYLAASAMIDSKNIKIQELEKENSDLRFKQHLDNSQDVINNWPEWKKNIL